MTEHCVKITLAGDTVESAIAAAGLTFNHGAVEPHRADAPVVTATTDPHVLVEGATAEELLIQLNAVLGEKYEAIVRPTKDKRSATELKNEQKGLAQASVVAEGNLAVNVSQDTPAPQPTEDDLEQADSAPPAAPEGGNGTDDAPPPIDTDNLDPTQLLQVAIDKLVKLYQESEGQAKVKALLSKYGVRKFAELDVSKAGDLLADADAIATEIGVTA